MVESWLAGVTQLVECNLAKVDVEGSSPFTRSSSCSPCEKGNWRKKSQQKREPPMMVYLRLASFWLLKETLFLVHHRRGLAAVSLSSCTTHPFFLLYDLVSRRLTYA